MSSLNDPRLINRIKRRYDLRGEGPQELSDLVLPVVVVDQLDEGQAGAGAAVDRAVSSGIFRTAAAAQYAAVQLWNYAGSGLLALLDRIVIGVETNASQIKGGHSTTMLGTGVVNPYLDGRIAGNAGTYLRHDDNAVATAPDEFWTRVPANTPYVFEIGAVVAEGEGYTFVCQTAQTSMYVTLYWREREITDLDTPT